MKKNGPPTSELSFNPISITTCRRSMSNSSIRLQHRLYSHSRSEWEFIHFIDKYIVQNHGDRVGTPETSSLMLSLKRVVLRKNIQRKETIPSCMKFVGIIPSVFWEEFLVGNFMFKHADMFLFIWNVLMMIIIVS